MTDRLQARPMVAEDLYELADDGYSYELSHGLLLAEPLPGGRHAMVLSKLDRVLGVFVEEHGFGVVLAGDPGFILHRAPDTVRGPDVAFITRARYAALADPSKAIPGPPDLAVEILSPSNRVSEIHAKVADYLAAGTRLVWVVDPAAATVTVYRSLLKPTVLGAEDELTADELLPGFRITVAQLFEF